MSTATAGALVVRLTANDQLTAPLGKVHAMVQRVTGSAGRLMTRLRGGAAVRQLGLNARFAARSLTEIIPPLSALTAAGTVAGVVRLAAGFADMGARLAVSAYRTQMTASGLHALQGAARLAGVSAEDLTSGLQGLGDALSDAAGGRDSNALGYFELLGVRIRNASGQARTAAEVLPEVADGIARISDPRLQARVMGALRLPESMLPFLRRGSAGLREWEAKARRFGVVSNENAAAATRFAESQATLRLAAEGLVNTLAARLAPSVGRVLERWAEWIGANREWIAAGVEQVVLRVAAAVERVAAAIGRWLQDGGWERFTARLEEIWQGIERVVSALGGWEPVIIGIGALLALHMVAPLAAIVLSLGRLAAWRFPAWMMRLLGVTGAGAAGAALMAMRPSETNAGEREELDRLRRDPEALAREHEPARAWSPRATWWDQFRNFPGERLPGYREPLTGMPNRVSREAQRALTPGGVVSGDPPGEATESQRAVYDQLRGLGWNEEVAAAIIANLQHESGRAVDWAAEGDGGQAYGIAQWHPERQRNFERWLADQNPGQRRRSIRESTRDEQVRFIDHELRRGTYRHVGRSLEGIRDTAEAARILSRDWEQPRDEAGNMRERARTARSLLPSLRRPAAPDTPAAPAAPAAPSAPAAPRREFERGGEHQEARAQPPAAQRVDVRVQLVGPGAAGATVTTRTPDGGVRVERAMRGFG